MDLLARFTRNLPDWLGNCKLAVRERVYTSPLMIGCTEGQEKYIRAFLIGAWPFVEAFPSMIDNAVERLVHEELFNQYGIKSAADLYRRGSQLLRGMREDEVSHRGLWIQTAEAVSVTKLDLYSNHPSQEVLALNSAVGNHTDLFKSFLHFVTVELVAEEISHMLLASPAFCSVLGKRGREWFRVHAEHHGEITHEEMAYRLAFALYGDDFPSEDKVKDIILHATDLFEAVASRCLADLSHA